MTNVFLWLYSPSSDSNVLVWKRIKMLILYLVPQPVRAKNKWTKIFLEFQDFQSHAIELQQCKQAKANLQYEWL